MRGNELLRAFSSSYEARRVLIDGSRRPRPGFPHAPSGPTGAFIISNR